MNFIKIFYLITLISINIFAQNYNLSGIIRNNEDKLPIPNTNISIKNTKYIVQSDINGFFTIVGIPSGIYQLEVSHVGFLPLRKYITINQSFQNIDISLNPNQFTIKEINITSLRYDKYLNEVAQPVIVVTSDQIKNSTETTLSEILNNEAGLSLMRDGIWGTSVSIRGLSKANIVVLINGNRLETATDVNAALSLVDPNEIERIEVIKGASSSIYGTGALGGVVNIITKTVNYSEIFKVKAKLGSSINSVNSGFYNNARLSVSDKNYYIDFGATFRNANETRTPNGILPNSQFRDNSINGNIGLSLIENHEMKFSGQSFRAYDVGIPGGGSLFPSTAVVRYPIEKRDLFSFEYKIINLFNIVNKFSAKYYYHEIYREVENIPNQIVRQPKREIQNLLIAPYAFHKINGLNIQTDFILAENNYLVFGFDYWQRNLDSRRSREQLIIDTLTSSIKTTEKITFEKPVPNSRFNSIGIYVQDEFELFNLFQFTLGGRYDKIIVNNDEVRNPVYEIIDGNKNENPPSQKLIWNAKTVNDNSWSANFNILYRLNSNINLTLNLARAFRAPNLEERYQFIDQGSLVRLGNPDLKSEEGYFVDIGIKIFEDWINSNLNLYYNSFSNLVVDIPSTYEGRKATIKSNVGKSRLFGFDFSLEANVMEDFDIVINCSYTNGEDTEQKTPLPLIAPLNGNLILKYKLLNYFNIDFTSTLFYKQERVASGEITTPGYGLFDIAFTTIDFNYNKMTFNFSAGIQNIFYKEYRNHLSTNRGSIVSEPGRNFFFKVNLAR